MGLKEASYVEIDDADTERTHLWIRVNDADGNMIELIEQYPLEERVRAYAMARRLADLLDLPLKLLVQRPFPAAAVKPSGGLMTSSVAGYVRWSERALHAVW